jgi:hypothetical protein
MTVNRNQEASTLPARLVLANQLMAAYISTSRYQWKEQIFLGRFLELADGLIAAHNTTAEEPKAEEAAPVEGTPDATT